MNRDARRIPLGIWLLMIGLSSILPFTFAWIAYFPPQGTVPTGIHGVDGSVFVACMRMFSTGFFSPFANCHSALGTHASAYFAAPFFWMYGVAGSVGRALHCNEFMALGIANGIGGFLYLLAVYLFLREAFPKHANLAFVLFTLAGGPGGVLYIVTGLLGLHGAPRFEEYFYRYALYQLFEGARPSPILTMPRLYYTVSLACCFGALACVVRARRTGSIAAHSIAAGLFFIGTLVNLRYGPMAWGILVLYLVVDARRGVWERLRLGLGFAIPVAIAWLLGWLVLQRSPAYIEGATTYIRTHMWLSPFLSAFLFHLAVVPGQVLRSVRPLERFARVASYGALGYLGAYFVLYILYSAYYGNVWLCLDVTSAIHISDPALIGALLGMGWACRKRPVSALSDEERMMGWAALWLVACLAISISAFFQGWFIRFVPERGMVFLGVPIAVCAAAGIANMRQKRPSVASALIAAMIVCGVCAIGVASLCFQGVLGHRPGHGPYGYTHCELVTQADADAMNTIPGGVVLTPVTYGPSMGDVLAQRPSTSVVFGFGSVNLSDRDQGDSKRDCERFFDKTSSTQIRKAIVDDWCVEYVYCPDSHPVDADVVAQLRQTPWLEPVVEKGNAAVFRVTPESRPQG